MEHSSRNENVTIIENEFMKFFPINFYGEEPLVEASKKI
jgi:hypothetical protein